MTTHLTDENFEKEINSTDKLVLVDFYADWCGPCKTLGPILEKIAEEMKDSLTLLKANVDNTPQNAGKFGVEKIPTIVLFKGGKVISGFVGLVPEQAIKEWIKNASENPTINIDEIIERYDNYAKSNGFRLNPNRKVVEGIVKGLLANEKKHGKRYCPCRRVTGNVEEDSKIICPCVFHKDELEKDGHCFCNLYVK